METFAGAGGREMHQRSPFKEGLYLSCGKCCQQTASSCQQVQGLLKLQGAASFVWGQALLAGSRCKGTKWGGAQTTSHIGCYLDSSFPNGPRPGWALITGQLLPLPNPTPASFCSQIRIPKCRSQIRILPRNFQRTDLRHRQECFLFQPLIFSPESWLLIFLSRKHLPVMSFGHDLRASSLSPLGPLQFQKLA